jgi:hypothetical protein
MSSHLTERDQLRTDLAKATDAYLAAGGCVEQVGFRMKDAVLPRSQYGRTGDKPAKPVRVLEVVAAPAALLPVKAEQVPTEAGLAGPVLELKSCPQVVEVVARRDLVQEAAAELGLESGAPGGWQDCDHQLAVQLLVEAALGRKISPTARKLGVSLSRCRRVAAAARVNFR